MCTFVLARWKHSCPFNTNILKVYVCVAKCSICFTIFGALSLSFSLYRKFCPVYTYFRRNHALFVFLSPSSCRKIVFFFEKKKLQNQENRIWLKISLYIFKIQVSACEYLIYTILTCVCVFALVWSLGTSLCYFCYIVEEEKCLQLFLLFAISSTYILSTIFHFLWLFLFLSLYYALQHNIYSSRILFILIVFTIVLYVQFSEKNFSLHLLIYTNRVACKIPVPTDW